jgi:hypothetical protein
MQVSCSPDQPSLLANLSSLSRPLPKATIAELPKKNAGGGMGGMDF